MVLLFWLSAALVAYVYVGYPVLLYCGVRIAECGFISRLRRRNPQFTPQFTPQFNPQFAIRNPQSDCPGISIIIAARNEAERLPARVENLLSLDYPADKRQIIVVSDGSTDNTVAVLRKYQPMVEVLTVRHGGKAVALNAGVGRAKFDIIVFADARQVFAPDALRELVAPFADPAIGGVTGELLLDCESALFSNRRDRSDRRRGHAGQLRAVAIERRLSADRRRSVLSTIADGVGVYWRYEKQLRRMESAVWSTLGATGAIYALRRTFWRPLPADAILDDVLAPMRVVLAGSRVVFNERARAFDRAAVDADAESRRKVRTLAGNYQILRLEPALLLPWRNPVWLQYVSHKLGRLAVPYALLALFLASVGLADGHPFYLLALSMQVLLFLLAGYGAILEWSSRVHASARPMTAPATRRAAQEVA